MPHCDCASVVGARRVQQHEVNVTHVELGQIIMNQSQAATIHVINECQNELPSDHTAAVCLDAMGRSGFWATWTHTFATEAFEHASVGGIFVVMNNVERFTLVAAKTAAMSC